MYSEHWRLFQIKADIKDEELFTNKLRSYDRLCKSLSGCPIRDPGVERILSSPLIAQSVHLHLKQFILQQ